MYLNCTLWYSRQHIIAREDFSDCIPSGHRQLVHWTDKCILNRQNHNGNHMTANEAPSNIIISFVNCTILYLFWHYMYLWTRSWNTVIACGWLCAKPLLYQCLNIIQCTLRNNPECRLEWNTLFTQESPFENDVSRMLSILFWPWLM